MTDIEKEETTTSGRLERRRFFLLGYGYLLTLGAGSWQTQSLNSLWFGTLVLVLAVPMMLALWHQSTVHRLIRLGQFRENTFLYKWGSRRALSILLRAGGAVLLAALTLLQTAYFGWFEWLLVGLSPLVFYVIHRWAQSKSETQFSKEVYATRWVFWFTQLSFLAILTTTFMCSAYVAADTTQVPYLDRVYQLQIQWDGAQSSVVKWVLDAGAYGQAAQESIASFNGQSYWKVLAAFFFAPLTVFASVALALSGLSLSRHELRRTIGDGVHSSDKPPSIAPVNAAVWAAVAAVLIGSYFQLLAYANQIAKHEDSPLAIRPMEPCEKIDGITYRINTVKAVESVIALATPKLTAVGLDACQQLTQLDTSIAAGVDDYLNWYFSLGADYARLAMILSGDVDLLLQSKINELVMGKLQQGDAFNRLQTAYENQWVQVHESSGAVQRLLIENRLNIIDRGCKVVSETTARQISMPLDQAKARLSTSAAAGLIGGVFASKLTAKVMTKSSVKISSKVLLKAVAKKAAGKAGGALAGAGVGAGIGAFLGPIGAAVGAGLGAAVGVAVGVGIDIAALAIEEGLTRDSMRKDLIDSVTETLRPMRDTFACK
jgi:hypothetical protein